jgi:hypothetical protein
MSARMTDIVERLRFIHRKVDIEGSWFDADVAEPIMRKAADEIERLNGLVARQDGLIERLRAEVVRYRGILTSLKVEWHD